MDKNEYTAAIERDYPRNFKAFILYDLLWGLGMPFSGSTLPHAFMVILGASKALIGVFSALPMVISLGQIFSSYYFRGHPKKKWLAGSYAGALIPWLIYSIVLFLFPSATAHPAALPLFLTVQIIALCATVGNEGIRFSMLTECTPLNKRGMLYGSRMAIQVVMSLMIWPLAIWMIGLWHEPKNYAASFAVAVSFYIFASFSYLLTREHQNPDIDNGRKQKTLAGMIRDTLETAEILWMDRSFRHLLSFSILLYISAAISSFIVVYAKDRMNMSGARIILFTLLNMIGGAAMSIGLGRLADRFGYKSIGTLQTIPLTAGFLIAAACAGSVADREYAVYAAFLLTSGITIVSRMVVMNLAIEMRPRQNIGMLLSATNAMITPFILVTIPLCGWLVDITGSYTLLFLIGAMTAGISGIGFGLVVREPRINPTAALR